MKLTIKPAAVQYLEGKATSHDHIFLALDDGSSKFSKLGGSCAIGNKYQLVIADSADADYQIPLAGNELTVTTAAPETDYFSNGLTLDYKNASLELRDDSGILDGAVTISRYTPSLEDDAKRREEMQTLGNKIC